MKNEEIQRVHVIFKTHLDIGFTNLAENIFRKYNEQFIPQALATAEALNTETETKFIWTVGAYIIDHYLRTASEENRARLENALQKGWITWHALPCTTHTELMDASLFRSGVEMARKLDRRFGKHTIAAKMSDVPGHTIAVVPLLAQEGIEYLHIGINDSSKLPKVPKVFRWQKDGQEIVVQYAASYGETAIVEGVADALVFMHAHDNEGPPKPEEVEAFFAELSEKFPNAVIGGSTLNDYARALRPVRDSLPVLTQEIGDTWIHGGGTDPKKTGAFERLLDLRREWEENPPEGYAETRDAFTRALFLIPEHTWGMDTKKYLYDFKNWAKADFREARKRDAIDIEALRAAPQDIQDMCTKEATIHAGGLISSYSLFERSHAEQRAYIDQAIAALPEDLAKTARAAIEQDLTIPECRGENVSVGQRIVLGDWGMTLCSDGSVLLDNGMRIGEFRYQVFSAATTDRCYEEYNRQKEETGAWSRPDFSKPGLSAVKDLKDKTYEPTVLAAAADDCGLTVQIQCEEEAAEKYGCPHRLSLRYEAANDGLKVVLIWKDKDANRIPEALWLGCYPSEERSSSDVLVQKLDQWVSPLDVVPGGNHSLHGCRKVRLDDLEMRCPDAPVVSVGGRRLYDVSDNVGDLTRGIHFLLFNNRWGTNFKMWYEDDARIELFVTPVQK